MSSIYCDLDGVLVDFKKGFHELTGMETKNIRDQNLFVSIFYYALINKNINEKDFWANLDWTHDGQELWDYIHTYSPCVLTAPMYNPELGEDVRYSIDQNRCMQGKSIWVQRLKNLKEVHFKESEKKSDFAGKGLILIDDREDIIESWIDRGGIGILHTSTISSINQLKRVLK